MADDPRTTLPQPHFDTDAEIERALRTIGDMEADVAFTLSPIGILRREDREIAYAAEIVALREVVAELERTLVVWSGTDG